MGVRLLQIVNQLRDEPELLEVAVGAADARRALRRSRRPTGSGRAASRRVWCAIFGRSWKMRSVMTPFIGMLMIARLDLRPTTSRTISSRSARTNWSPPESVTQTGTFSSVGKIRPYSSTERSSTFFCQMSHVAQRDGHEYVTDTVRLTGSCLQPAGGVGDAVAGEAREEREPSSGRPARPEDRAVADEPTPRAGGGARGRTDAVGAPSSDFVDSQDAPGAVLAADDARVPEAERARRDLRPDRRGERQLAEAVFPARDVRAPPRRPGRGRASRPRSRRRTGASSARARCAGAARSTRPASPGRG